MKIKKINADYKISAQEINSLEKGQTFAVRVIYCKGEERNFFEQTVSKRKKEGILTVVRFVIQSHHLPDINALNSAKPRSEFEFEIEKVKFCDEIKDNVQLVKVFGKLVSRKALPFSLYGFTVGEEREVVFEGMKSGRGRKYPNFAKINSSDSEIKETFYVNLFNVFNDKYQEETIVKLRDNGPHKIWKARICYIGDNSVTVRIVGVEPVGSSHPPFEYLGLKIGMGLIEVEVITPKEKDKKEEKKNYILPFSYCHNGQRVLFFIDEDQKKSKILHQQAILGNAKHKEVLFVKILELFMSKKQKGAAIALVRILDPAEVAA